MNQAFRISIFYIIFCSLYILFSDKLVYKFFPSAESVTYIQTVKGVSFVLFSGAVIFVLINRSFKNIKNVNVELEKTVDYHKMIFDKCPLPAYLLSWGSLLYIRVNDAALRKFGRVEEDYLNNKVTKFLSGVDEEDILLIRNRVQERGYLEVNLNSITKSGKVINQNVFCQLIIYENEKAIFAIANDVTALRSPENVMMDRVLRRIENDRRRIASEIHDSLKQYFGLANGLLKSFKTGINGSEKLDVRLLDRSIELMENGVEESRRLSHSITPFSTNDFDLIQSVTYLVENLNHLGITKYEVEADFTGSYTDIIKVNIFRLIQEAVNNIQAHANAKNVKIKLFDRNSKLNLDIIDDGDGFDTRLHIESMNSIGLKTMRTRVSKYNGTFSLSSKIGEGTHVSVRIPVTGLVNEEYSNNE